MIGLWLPAYISIGGMMLIVAMTGEAAGSMARDYHKDRKAFWIAFALFCGYFIFLWPHPLAVKLFRLVRTS